MDGLRGLRTRPSRGRNQRLPPSDRATLGFTRRDHVALEWKHSIDGVDWKELSALYRAAPLGDKKPLHLQTVFSNSMFRCFVYDNARLVAAGRALERGYLRCNREHR
jgi:hypothetical protein